MWRRQWIDEFENIIFVFVCIHTRRATKTRKEHFESECLKKTHNACSNFTSSMVKCKQSFEEVMMFNHKKWNITVLLLKVLFGVVYIERGAKKIFVYRRVNFVFYSIIFFIFRFLFLTLSNWDHLHLDKKNK